MPQSRKLVNRTTLLFIFIISGCGSFSSLAHKKDQVLDVFEVKPCEKGYIRPAGVAKCLNINQILQGTVKEPAPVGKCPAFWQRYRNSRFCMPSAVLVACGPNTFPCSQSPGDAFRIEQGPPNCKDGTVPVAVPIPFFNQSGELFLQARTGIMCGPLGSGDPL